jgi:pimeloyl-ACP methyl ester carboxylesterase
MTPTQFAALRKVQDTPSGRISYVDRGSGPVALFVHGFPLNGYHWRHQLEALDDIRRCIAPDLLGLGFSEVTTDQSLRFDAQAQMLREFIDALGIREIDLIGNDSGGAIAQILATQIPDRIRSLTLTNCDVHDNWPPPAFMPLFQLAKEGQLGRTLAGLLANPDVARSPRGLGMAFQFSERLADDILGLYLAPIAASPARQAGVDRYTAAMDPEQTVRIYADLGRFAKPTLIVWGNDDVFFPERWAQWLADTIPGVRNVKILNAARLFFPEERADEFNELLRAHWLAAEPRPAAIATTMTAAALPVDGNSNASRCFSPSGSP